MTETAQSSPRRTRFAFWYDLAWVPSCVVLAFKLRFAATGIPPESLTAMLWMLGITAPVFWASLWRFGLDNTDWQRPSVGNVVNLLKAVAFGLLVSATILFIAQRLNGVPRTVLYVFPALLVVVLALSRLAFRYAYAVRHDLPWIALSAILAFALRLGSEGLSLAVSGTLGSVLLVTLLVFGATFWYLGLYRAPWGSFSFADIRSLIKAVAIGALVNNLILFLAIRPEGVPRKSLLLFPLLLLGMMAAARLTVRTVSDHPIVANWARRVALALYLPALLGVSAIVALFTISTYNENLAWEGARTRSSTRLDEFFQRKDCVDQLIDRTEPNYRTLYVAQKFGEEGYQGLNWHLIAETEMQGQDGQHALFAYRESDHPFTGVMARTFQGGRYIRFFPPIANTIAPNLRNIRLMGVKYVVSSGERIEDGQLVYRGHCKSVPTNTRIRPDGYSLEYFLNTRGVREANFYIYELRNPQGIVFAADRYEILAQITTLLKFGQPDFEPWAEGRVILEQSPQEPFVLEDQGTGTGGRADLAVHESPNRVEIRMSTPDAKFVVIGYAHRPFWRAYVDGERATLYRAYGGLMAVAVPPGEHVVVVKYTAWDYYAGIVALLLAFALIVPGVRKRIWR